MPIVRTPTVDAVSLVICKSKPHRKTTVRTSKAIVNQKHHSSVLRSVTNWLDVIPDVLSLT